MIAIMTEPCRVPRMAQMEAERLAYMMGQTASARFRTRLEFVHADFANAFALPGGTIVVTDRLLAMLGPPDQFAGCWRTDRARRAGM
ncbi:MAG: hypothetical protein R3C52_00935 [Hyphomonadaceae bacterium]